MSTDIGSVKLNGERINVTEENTSDKDGEAIHKSIPEAEKDNYEKDL